MDDKKYKDKMGRYRTMSLFKELYTKSKEGLVPVYSLMPYDKPKLPSARRIYLECNDPTEYEVAMKLLGSWPHWKLLCEKDWFEPYLTEWREELEVKLRSKGLRQIIGLATDEDTSESTKRQAAQYLSDKGWATKVDTRGRPSKLEVRRELKQRADMHEELDHDFDRLMFTEGKA